MYKTDEILDRLSPIPLYHQLKELLVEHIKQGEFANNKLFPTEAQLVESYNVSRVTVRRSLHELENEGYITRMAGKGTFVLQSRMRRELSRLSSFSEEMKDNKQTYTTKILSAKRMKADLRIAEKLLVEPGVEITYIFRIRYINDVPVVLTISHLRLPEGVEITHEELQERGSLWALLESKGVNILGADKTMDAIAANKRHAEQLEVETGAPLLLVESVVYTDMGLPIEYNEVVSIGGLYKYSLSLAR